MASKSKKLGFAADIFEQDIEGIIRKIRLGEIQPSAEQPRTRFDETITALAESIKTEGLLQPIVVTKEGTHYKIIAGERRYRAAKLLGLEEIECRILRKNAKDTYRLAVIENLQRENLDPIDESRAFRRLKTEYGHTDAELAQIVGKSRNYVSEILSVAEIPSSWIDRAKNAGIESKNLFIQFAQAVKSGSAEQFITAFSSGNLTTVASAKQFNRANKPDVQPKRPAATGAPAEVSCSSEQSGRTAKFTITVQAGQALPSGKVKALESALVEIIKRQLK
ncbi:ParB/RepB/Spo0J family partition protein [Turneriella parva]|uniref:ParB family protein n=1 Tax=Turneriella parva (strain ATCC BAA-1111 / DSM 21527 / NCTC 11395 / H) TaxID=869212 RepID=I4BC04_TURPD|nr:ParB/RepB/Spo0J family partition protein [Turneriella parva]AFM14811.1 ParB family protein [Turneriella parva DSM 21527]